MDQSLIRKARRRLLDMHYHANVGHLGGNLSCLEILMTLYHDVMTDNDTFILSKGHAAGALYVTMWTRGLLSGDQLCTFHGEGTSLPGHTPANTFPCVPFATGSLGHGLSLACGVALARKLRGESGRVYVLTSDGEWNEGSCWEALSFSVHHKLGNLCIIIDRNGMQGMGPTSEVSGMTLGVNKFSSFGVAYENIYKTSHSLVTRPRNSNSPVIIICNTVKGCGVSFMEDDWKWHYRPMDKEQYEQALSETSAEGQE